MKLIFSKKIDPQIPYIDYETLNLFIENKLYFNKKMISKLSDSFYKSVGIWHVEYFNTNFKTINWQYSQNSRIAAWYPYSLSPLLKFCIILEIVKFYKLEKVTIIGSSKDTYDLFKEQIKNGNLSLINNQFNFYNHSLKKIIKIIYLFKKRVKEIFKLFLIFIVFIFQKKIKKSNKKYDLLFLTFDLNNTIQDHFYGDISKFKLKFKSKFNLFNINFKINNNENYSFNYIKWINLKDFSWLLFNLLSFIFIKKKIINPVLTINISKQQINSQLFPLNFTKEVISSSFILFELIIYKSLLNFFKYNDVKNLVFPLENKPIEYSILNSVKNSNKQIKTHAYLHANYSSGHLSINNLLNYNKLFPNVFLSKNTYQQNRLINHYGWKPQLFELIGNLRRVNYSSRSTSIVPNTILFISGYGFELIEFSKWCVDLKDTLKNFTLVIKPYPFAWLDDQQIAFNNLKLNQVNFSINTDLIKSINNSSIILFNSTSAGLELLHSNKIIINLDIDNRYFINPLKYLDNDNFLLKYSSSKNLKLFLENYLNNKHKTQTLLDQKKYYDLDKSDNLSMTYFFNLI